MSRARQIPALAASLAALAIGVGCGGGGEDASSTSVPQAEEQAQAKAEASAEVKKHNAEVKREYQERQQAEAPTPEEQEAEQTATDFYAILGEDRAEQNPNRTTIDSEGFCELMSEAAVVQTIHYAKVSSGIAREWNCESAVELLVLRSKRSGGFEQSRKAEVIGVNTEGDKATATVRFGNGPATALPLVREDGEWKLGASSLRP